MASNTTMSRINTTMVLLVNNTTPSLDDNDTSISDIVAAATPSSQTSQKQEQMSMIMADIKIVSYTLLPVIFAIGIFGNLLTLIIMSMDAKITSMASRYVLVLLAVCDMSMLVMHVFNKQGVRQLIGSDPRANHIIGCKTFFHIYRTVKMMSSWLVVMLCLERFIAVVFPHKFKTIITRRRVISLIVCTFVLLVAFNAVATSCTAIMKSKKSLECKQYGASSQNKTMYRIILVLSNALFSWIPGVAMSALTPVIVFKLIKRVTKMDKMSTTTQKGTETTRISVMLVGVVIAYVIFIIPVTLFHINNSFLSFGLKKNTPEFLIVKEIVQYLEMMNFSTNFIMYTFGSVAFRNKAVHLFCACRTKSVTSPRNQKSSSGNQETRSSVVSK